MATQQFQEEDEQRDHVASRYAILTQDQSGQSFLEPSSKAGGHCCPPCLIKLTNRPHFFLWWSPERRFSAYPDRAGRLVMATMPRVVESPEADDRGDGGATHQPEGNLSSIPAEQQVCSAVAVQVAGSCNRKVATHFRDRTR